MKAIVRKGTYFINFGVVKWGKRLPLPSNFCAFRHPMNYTTSFKEVVPSCPETQKTL